MSKITKPPLAMIEIPTGSSADDQVVNDGTSLVLQTPLSLGESAKIKDGTFDSNTGILTLVLDGDRVLNISGLPTLESIGQGRPGDRGATGNDGRAGRDGINGRVGLQGCRGPAGGRGMMGGTGPTGNTGPAGATGATGINGATGATGAQGRDGLAGILSCTTFGGIEYVHQSGIIKQWGRHIANDLSQTAEVIFGRAFEGDVNRINLQLTWTNMNSIQAQGYRVADLTKGGFLLAVDEEIPIGSNWDFFWAVSGDDGAICGTGGGSFIVDHNSLDPDSGYDPDQDPEGGGEDNNPTNNAPDISIAAAEDVNEPTAGDIEEMLFPVSLSSPLAGDDLTVTYVTVNDSAMGQAGNVKHIAYDAYSNPFISVMELNDYNAVLDGGFPKYYNARATDSNAANARQFMANAIQWVNQSGIKKVLLLGDTPESSSYSVKDASTSSTGFKYTFELIISLLVDYTLDIKTVDEISEDPTQFAEYGAIVYIGSASYNQDTSTVAGNGYLLTDEKALAISDGVRLGTGIVLITDHGEETGDTLQFMANKIARNLGAEFFGNIDRAPVSVESIIEIYGDHPLWDGITGYLQAGDSEGNVRITDFDGDFISSTGTLTFSEGETLQQVRIPIIGDNLSEPEEQFKVVLTESSRGSIVNDTALGKIID